MALVSVIIPSYNHGNYLEQRIDSILKQTYTDFELIILDDNSPDQSWEIIKSYSNHPKVKIIEKNAVNSGSTFYQWQKGMGLASGKYIWIAESDDYADPDFLKCILDQFHSNANIGVCFTPSIWVDYSNNIIEMPSHEVQPFIRSGHDLIKNDFTTGCLIYNASAAVFCKELIQNVDFELITKNKLSGDWLFWVQLIKNTQVSRIGKRLNYFRRHTNNVSTKSGKLGLQFSEGFAVVKYIFEKYNFTFFQKQKIYLKWASKVYYSQEIEPNIALKLLPTQINFWYKIMKLVNLVRVRANNS